MSAVKLYLLSVLIAAAVSAAATPAVRALALALGWLDRPSSGVKTHVQATALMGGAAVWLGFTATLVAMRFLTQFRSGTLHSLRAVVSGGAIVFLLGVIDDVRKPEGLGFKTKFAVQIAAAILLVLFGIRIRFIHPGYLAVAFTLLWVVGITNAFNIIDVMDGLCASQAAVAALAFLCISLPSERIYVNFTSAALLGAVLGFLPWNLSSKGKIFLGDSGSLAIGFVLAAAALGTDYSHRNPLGVYAPLFILLVPMYDTFFVMAVRLLKGRSPFLGSKDHFALRLAAAGLSRGEVVAVAACASLLLSLCALLVTVAPMRRALAIYAVVSAAAALASRWLYRLKVEP